MSDHFDKPVLITGAGGFIGSHLTEACLQAGYRVRAFVHYNSRSNTGFLQDLPHHPDLEIIAGDVRDYDSIHAACKGVGAALHLAALIGIPYSQKSPLAYIRTNVEGTYNILEAARQHLIPHTLIVSSSEAYGPALLSPMNESHPSCPRSPYAATKLAAEQLALTYHHTFGLPVRVLRPFNTFGPRQSMRAVVPSIIVQILQGKRTLFLGNTSPTRDLTYVTDTVAGMIQAAFCTGLDGRMANLGTGREISIGDLVHTIARLMEVEVEIKTDPERMRTPTMEVDRLCCDSTQLRGLTGWKPVHGLEAGLERTIDWFRRQPAGGLRESYVL